MTTKTEFSDWLSHPITEVVFEEIKDRIRALNEELIQSGGDALKTAKLASYILAYRDLVNITYEELE
jgi:hypothetical protein